MFENAFIIVNQGDISKFVQKVFDLDLATNYYFNRPSSSWVFCGLTNIQLFIFRLKDTLVGAPVILPSYVIKSKSIIGLDRDFRGKPYRDNKFFLRCLSIHNGHIISSLERQANKLQTQVESKTKKNYDGVNLSDIPEIERVFEISINIYSLQEDGKAFTIYVSKLKYQVLYLNLYKNHFSFIKNIRMFSKMFQCDNCQLVFTRNNSFNRHIKLCSSSKKEVFPGNKYQQNETVFEKLGKEGYFIQLEDRYYEYISCFDFEAILVPRKERIGVGISIKSIYQLHFQFILIYLDIHW